jgi:choline dehydrogenase-like flavoprotein
MPEPMGIFQNQHAIDCSQLQENRVFDTDVAIIGTGAGGGIAAQTLARAGLKVIMIEEGAYKTSRDFSMQEAQAYPELYYEVANRKTADKAITILQGRTVGGGTTVNWTSCFRIPDQTLSWWRDHYGWTHTGKTLAPWYETVETLLNIKPWIRRNPSNSVLERGAGKLGWQTETIARNVRACRDLGYCGLGCPVDAKQSTLVTAIPSAMKRGATVLSRLRAHRLRQRGGRVEEIECHAIDERGTGTTGITVRVRARHVVLSAGGIGSPALLLRSGLPDPAGLVGKRTFLHLTAGTFAFMPDKVDPYYGAPQSVTSNEFLWRDGVGGEVGYKIETVPLQPALAATAIGAFGSRHAEVMARLPHVQPLIALLRDGFHPDSPGGTVSLGRDGHPVLDYPMSDYLWRGLRHAYGSLLQIQFAAGATVAAPAHSTAGWYRSWPEAKTGLTTLPMRSHLARLYSAHVMGGCTMGPDPAISVVDLDGNHHHLGNVTVIDGSIFPTSVGANPSLPIYAMAAWQSDRLARRLCIGE